MASSSNYEQYMLELINRARLDPLGEAQRLGIDLNQGLPAGSISAAAKQPLASNGFLIDSARAHSKWMLDTDTFSHTGAGGSDPGDRMAAAGYKFTGSWTWGENISYRGTSGTLDLTGSVGNSHDGLFRSAGHRKNILNDNFREIGVGVETGTFNAYNAAMVTQNFAKSGTKFFLTGVAYNDTNGNGFYTPGEGASGLTVSFLRSDGVSGAATTQPAGGYQAAVDPGSYTVTFSGAALPGAFSVGVTVGSQNVKLDLVNGNTVQSSADITLGANATNATLLGVAALNATGNALANVIAGNKGANVLSGGGGDDRLSGGAGNDTIDGGAGQDTVVLSGRYADYTITSSGGAYTIRDNRAGGDGLDSVKNVETAQFSDRTISLGSSQTEPDPDQQTEPEPDPDQQTEPQPSVVTGTAGKDVLSGGTANERLVGLGGNDVLNGSTGADVLDGGDGVDTASYGGSDAAVKVDLSTGAVSGGWAAGDTLTGIESLIGSGHADVLAGDGKANILKGGAGNDLLLGRGGNDVLDGGAGTDTASYAGSAAVRVILSAAAAQNTYGGGVDRLVGIENLVGSSGSDLLAGHAGANALSGGDGNDRLYGLGGKDVLAGGAGRDLLTGGTGRDVLTGGAGADIFNFNALAESTPGLARDLVTDFKHSELDLIDLRTIDANTARTGDQAFKFIGDGSFTKVAGQLHQVAAGSDTIIEGDVNGDAVADFQIQLTGVHGLTAADFLL